MGTLLVFLVLAAPPRACPPQSLLPVVDDVTVRKSCHCSERCVCGCNGGKPCSCGAPRVISAAPSYQPAFAPYFAPGVMPGYNPGGFSPGFSGGGSFCPGGT